MGSGAAASQRSLFNWLDKQNATSAYSKPLGLDVAYENKYGQDTSFKAFARALPGKMRDAQEALRAPDLTDEIIKSVARAELARKRTGMTRESTFVADRPSPSQMDAERKKNPALNQYTPKPKPPGAP